MSQNNAQATTQDVPMVDVSTQGQNKQNLLDIIAHYKAKLDKLVNQFKEVLDTATAEQLQGRQADIANTQKTLDSFRYTYEKEYGEKSEPSSSKKPKESGNTTPKVVDKMSAKDVPLFQVTGFTITDSKKEIFPTASRYLDHFEKILNATTSGCKKTWKKWLPLAVPHDLDHWFNRKVFHRKGITWTEARKVIQKRFTAIDQQMHKAREAYTMMQLPGESVADYGIRFMNTARDGGLKDNGNLALQFLTSLQARIQENVQVAWTGKRGTRQPKKVSDILRVANSVSVYKQHQEQKQV
ncbi:hypothetical protein K492DRAFT_202428 [Lichtheimia hyalospora FSU 10163]|nr:hypothetical protein K492DRAFT_202428 [Lichtheimia hyalospora FSU 10163]